jgi:hypothetical protein
MLREKMIADRIYIEISKGQLLEERLNSYPHQPQNEMSGYRLEKMLFLQPYQCRGFPETVRFRRNIA